MRFQDIQKGKFYKKNSNGLVIRVNDIEYKPTGIYLKWQAMNRKTLDGRIFSNNIMQIDFYDMEEEKDFEKYTEN